MKRGERVPILRPTMGAYQRELRRDIERAKEAAESRRADRQDPISFVTHHVRAEKVLARIRSLLAQARRVLHLPP